MVYCIPRFWQKGLGERRRQPSESFIYRGCLYALEGRRKKIRSRGKNEREKEREKSEREATDLSFLFSSSGNFIPFTFVKSLPLFSLTRIIKPQSPPFNCIGTSFIFYSARPSFLLWPPSRLNALHAYPLRLFLCLPLPLSTWVVAAAQGEDPT
mmetsp:Transcript_53395/g.104430  ORF Transcript_53395/g.104430 Transcript_53395/m.104430 type:complete len:154 (+) Transcript_53395:409-870(+)